MFCSGHNDENTTSSLRGAKITLSNIQFEPTAFGLTSVHYITTSLEKNVSKMKGENENIKSKSFAQYHPFKRQYVILRRIYLQKMKIYMFSEVYNDLTK